MMARSAMRKMMRTGLATRIGATLLTGGAAALLAGCGAPETARDARPAMWLVADEDTRIYLLGTMHALPRGLNWDGGAVAKAIAEADMLILELAPSQSAKVGDIFSELSRRVDPMPVEKRLGAPARAIFAQLSRSERALFSEKLDDWAIVVLLGQKSARAANLNVSFGVEAGLTDRFADAGKNISGLETAQSQLMMFETLDAATQRQLLNDALLKSGHAAADVEALIDAWAKGDVAALARRIREDVESVPAAYQSLLTDRNHRWAAWAAQRMDSAGTILVAVGAGHMVGDEGLPALMKQQGYQVTRIQ